MVQAQDRMEFYTISSGVEDTNYVIRYWVRFEGLVEFFVLNKQGKRVWFHSAVRKQGEYGIRVFLSKLEPGSYTYMFRYKNKNYTGEFEVPSPDELGY
jgi:hypothetical protein